VIEKDEARALAEDYLQGLEGDLQVVILDSLTQDHGWSWLFFFDSRRHVETGDYRYALLGNGPVLVDKRNGEIQQIPPAMCSDIIGAVAQAKRRKFPSVLRPG